MPDVPHTVPGYLFFLTRIKICDILACVLMYGIIL